MMNMLLGTLYESFVYNKSGLRSHSKKKAGL